MATPTGQNMEKFSETPAPNLLPRRLFGSDLLHGRDLGQADGASLQRAPGEADCPRPQAAMIHAEDRMPPLETTTFGDREDRPTSGATAEEAGGRSSTKLPRYNGESPLATYLVQVRLAAKLNGWSAERTGVQVALALEGKALQVLEDLPPAEQTSWSAIEAALQRRYGQRIFADDARDQLASRRRRKDERQGEFAADLRLYARRGYPTFSQSQQEEMALQTFVRGIYPERLREHLRLYTPTSLSAALEEAERVEHILCTAEPKHHVRLAVRQGDGEELETTRQATALPPQRRQREWKRPARGDGCYRCGEPGHIARNCPAPAPLNPAPQLN